MPGNLMWVFPFYYFLLPVNITWFQRENDHLSYHHFIFPLL
jgi:hypothetical protein